MTNDPYKVMGLSRGASDEEIKKAYRELVKKYHPDLHPNDSEAARKMSEVNAAYEQIRTETAKEKTDSGTDGRAYYKYMDPDDIIITVFESLGKASREGFKGHIEIDYDPYPVLDRYVERGSFRQAALVLDSLTERDSRWYYYAARVSLGAGNLTEAARYADYAVNMARGNQMYRLLRQRIHEEQDAAERGRTLRHLGMVALCAAVLCIFAAVAVYTFVLK